MWVIMDESVIRRPISEDPATGHIHERPDLVRMLTETYHALQTSTLTAAASIELIREVRKEI